jgi:hypothetical protein
MWLLEYLNLHVVTIIFWSNSASIGNGDIEYVTQKAKVPQNPALSFV